MPLPTLAVTLSHGSFASLTAGTPLVCRPAVAAHWVEETLDGKIRITLKNEWVGGVNAVVMSPRDLVLRLLAQDLP